MALKVQTVRDLMTTELAVVVQGDPLQHAADVMHQRGLSCVLVDLGDPAQGFGILTQKDLVLGMGEGWDGKTVGMEMTHPCVCIAPHYNVETALDLMRMVGIRRAPVVEQGQLVGILSLTDIFRWHMRSAQRRAG